MVKLLIIRISSFGDIVQALGVPAVFRMAHPKAEIHWVVRNDFADLVSANPRVKSLWIVDRTKGIWALWTLIQNLRREEFTHVYDAHNNLRSNIICFFLKLYSRKLNLARRSKNRIKRFLLFRMGQNLFPKPFIAQDSFLRPLTKWSILPTLPPAPQFFVPAEVWPRVQAVVPFQDYIALCPSAAWELKRWPVNYWKRLIELLPDKNFVILGGPDDSFCAELVLKGREQSTVNLAGRLTLVESCAIVEKAKMTISNDTGLLHVADQLGVPLIALIGPTAFGYPARASGKVIEMSLACRPCSKDGRGNCKNAMYKKCLRDISPERVRTAVLENMR